MTKEFFNLDAERSVIGCCILCSGDCLPKLKGRLYPDHFYHTSYKIIYQNILEMHDAGMVIDSVTLTDKLRKSAGGPNVSWHEEVIVCFESVPTTSSYEYYARIIIQHFVNRKTYELSMKRIGIVSRGEDIKQLLDITREEEELFKLLDKPTDGRELLNMSIAEMERIKGGYEMSTGLAEVDGYSLGLSRGRFYVVGGETSHGKTAFAIWCSVHNLLLGNKVNYYNYDISSQDCFRRMLGVVYQIPLSVMYSPAIDNAVMDKFKQNGEDFCAKFIDNGQLVIREYTTLDKIELDLASEDRGVVFVDYLQTAFSSEEGMSDYNVAWHIGKYVSRLKRLASKYNVCMVGLSQYRRRIMQESKFKERDNSDLKESGYIEQGANTIMLLDWPNRRDGTKPLNNFSINISKSTFGRVGKVTVDFEPNTQRFSDGEFTI